MLMTSPYDVYGNEERVKRRNGTFCCRREKTLFSKDSEKKRKGWGATDRRQRSLSEDEKEEKEGKGELLYFLYESISGKTKEDQQQQRSDYEKRKGGEERGNH